MWCGLVCILQLCDACLIPSCQLPWHFCQWSIRQRRPQGLKPAWFLARGGTAKAVPCPKALPKQCFGERVSKIWWSDGPLARHPITSYFYRSLSPYAEAGSTWFEVGPGTAFPCSSIFMPRLRPIEERISLISFSDFRPKFFVFRISASVFCTNSPMD